MIEKMIIRDEQINDIDVIKEINDLAFKSDAEGQLIDRLRGEKIDLISLVAEENAQVLGHILFSPASIHDKEKSTKIIGLAPMAVHPSFQRKGIGSALIKEGLNRCIKKGYGAIVVLGHPEYYPKFGFVPSVKYNISSEYDVPEEVFMILELRKDFLKGISGKAKYHPAFNEM